MYLVRRPFRNYGQMMVPGSFVEPGSIKRFKSRLNDGKIVEVNEHNFDKWEEWFRERAGVQIHLPGAPEDAKPEKSVEPDKVPEEPKPAEAKVVVKPVSK